MMRRSRTHILGAALGVPVLLLGMTALAQNGYTPPKELPKGMSTKQPSLDKPGPSVEDLQGLPGAPDPSNNDDQDPSFSYPEGLKLSDAQKNDQQKPAEDNKGSLPPIEKPVAPKVLTLKFERPLTYAVRGTHRLAIEDREDLKQIYLSSARVTYEKLADLASRPKPLWVVSDEKVSEKQAKETSLTPMLLTVERSIGRYTYPELLAESERVHQITRAAQLSYLIDPKGKIEDVQVHEPTNPLAKNSIEHFAHMLSLSQAVFPDRPVQPGDTWTQQVLYRDGKGLAQLSEDSTNTFTFESWRACRKGMCAFIKIKQDLRVAGRLLVQKNETQGTSIGEGEGWILFDYETGEVVKSFMKIKGLGTVKALSKDAKGGINQEAQARLIVEYEVTSERVDSEDAQE